MDIQDEHFTIDDEEEQNPVEPISKNRARPRFLGDGLDDDNVNEEQERAKKKTMDVHDGDDDRGSLDGYFDDLNDEPRLPAPLNHSEIEATLAAKKIKTNTNKDPFSNHNNNEEGEGEGEISLHVKKVIKRRKIIKIDENRLLDTQVGIPKLIQISKSFKPTGKGNEREDLKRLLKIYRLWSHQVLPNGNFKDNIERIEKVCQKNRMKSALVAWRKEYLESTGKNKKNQKDKSNEGIIQVDEGTTTTTTGEQEPEQQDDQVLPDRPPLASTSHAEILELSNARSPIEEGPLFRPADGSDDEFPLDDDINFILNNISTT